ncbi:MAG: hypothetical protein B6U89_05360 [Desulfurococcales archaeon ex4484_58]|nr:MAG: hypothetical protein B6U89_05360 [Desulfurococcales archaeon ex4484_58]
MHSRSSLDILIRDMRFNSEPKTPYLLPGIFLAISMPTYASLIYIALYHGLEEAVNSWYRNFVLLYLAYVLTSSYIIYRYNKVVKQHLFDSGIITYYWMRQRNDVSAIKSLYRSSFVKRDLPSPTTSLILVLVTFGLAYPILLYILEKNLRIHASSEEKLLLRKTVTRRIEVGQALLDIAATILTIGIYMIYWGYRVVNTYNKHLRIIHKDHPEPPQEMLEYRPEIFPDKILLGIGLALLGAGIYGLLGLFGLPAYLPTTIGYGSLIASLSYSFSRDSISYHLGKTYTLIYFVFLVSTIMGFIGAPSYDDLFKTVNEQVGELVTNDSLVLTSRIFTNNLAISLVSMSPIYGAIYLGVGMINAALVYGYALVTEIPRGNTGLLLLPVLPHTILELFGYAVFITISTRLHRIRDDKSIIYLILLGVFVLMVAAYIEALTILLGRPE